MIVVLAGGVGAGKLLEGLQRVVSPEELFVVVNTGDDREFFGLHVSPDVDIVTYTMAGAVDPVRRWGFEGDTFDALAQLRVYYGDEDTWFNLGDRDIATHVFRTHQLKLGRTLSEVTEVVRKALGVRARVVPMSDDEVATHVKTPSGSIHFEEYFVKNQAGDEVLGVEFTGAAKSKPAPGILDAIRECERVVVCPSNPVVSIGPILAVPGVRDVLRTYKFKAVAVSPIVAGKPVKGPADRLMAALGYEVSCVGVASIYQDVVDAIVIDQQDAALAPRIERMGLRVGVTDTVMSDLGVKEAVARLCLEL
ncbi:MAG: 2-phospho-L-lactate transferase [Promethearchaeota archaeon]